MKKIAFLFLLFAVAFSCKRNSPPTASFLVNTTAGNTETEFVFDASGSLDAQTTTDQLQVRWDWENSGNWTPFTPSKSATHLYSKAGTYTVVMEIKDPGGLTHSVTKTITVDETKVETITPAPVTTKPAATKAAAPKATPSKTITPKTNSPNTATQETVTPKPATPANAPDGHLTDPRDGNTYPFKIIGTQKWMAANLAWLPAVSPSTDGSQKSPSYYVYDFKGKIVAAAKGTANYTTYGVLYNWEAAKKACPEGWHLPSQEEWKVLEKYLGMSEEDLARVDSYSVSGAVGGQLKESGTTHWQSPNEGANNSTGFTALPGGYRNAFGDFGNQGKYGYFWTSTEGVGTLARYHYMGYEVAGVFRSVNFRNFGLSVRCVQNM